MTSLGYWARFRKAGAALVELLAAVTAAEPPIALRRALRPMPDGRGSTCRAPHPASSPLKRAAAYPTTTGIRHLAQVLTEPATGRPRSGRLRKGVSGCNLR